MGREPLPAPPGFSLIMPKALSAWLGNGDSRIAACNLLAFVVGGNQPFYPLYVWGLVGTGVFASCCVLLSVPLFLAVPSITRRSPNAGKALLPLAGIANTVICAIVLGVGTGVEVFLIPCALIAALAFGHGESRWSLSLIAITAGAYSLHQSYPAPLVDFTRDQQQHLAKLNFLSMITLCLFVLWQFRTTIMGWAGFGKTVVE